MTEKNTPMVRLAGLYENRTKAGETYFAGYLGGVKLLILRDKRATEGQPGWTLLVTPRPEKKDACP